MVGASVVAAVMISATAGWAPPSPAADRAVPVVPVGMATLIGGGAWSWFSDSRATFDADGTTLYTTAVDSGGGQEPVGSVLVSELSLVDGAQRVVNLGAHLPDDHNNASIWVDADGEVTTAWSQHGEGVGDPHAPPSGGRLLGGLAPIATSQRTTYNNLLTAAGADGTPVRYDFFRGERFDQEVLTSRNRGRTWASAGRLLRDPLDQVRGRPYVQYRQTGPDRIDLIATEGHPDDAVTSIYHGYISGGLLHRSDGLSLGPVGSAIPATAG